MMKKLLGILVLGLLFLSACQTTSEVLNSGKIRKGITKVQLKAAYSNTGTANDIFYSNNCYREYFSDVKMEILSSDARDVWYVFENVTFPKRTCKGNDFGNGNLYAWTPTYSQAKTQVSNIQTKKIAKKTKPKKSEPKKSEPKKFEPGKLFAVASGTGFFINASGNIISNNHVIDSCGTVKVHYNGVSKPVTILATDYMNDLSLMKSDIKPDDYFSVSSNDANLLDEIYVAGYPFGKAISSSVKVTKGVVSALTGLGNNYSNIQIDAALQPGNSGGPIINNKGNVVGVAVAKLDYKAIIEDFNAIPEGTNFGIKSSTVQQFIKANNVGSETGGYREMSSQNIGKKIQKATVYLDCWMTAQQINQYKTRKTFFTNIE